MGDRAVANKPDHFQIEARRRVFFGVGGLLIVLAASAWAFLQPPHPIPFDPIDPLRVENWLSPMESNTFRRLTGKLYQEAQVYGSGDGSRLWVTTREFVLSSDDYGETWDRAATPDESYLIDDEEIGFELTALATADGGNVVVGIGGNGYLIQRSDDGGETWRLVSGKPNLLRNSQRFGAHYRETLRAVALSADGTRGIAVGALGALLSWRAEGTGGSQEQVALLVREPPDTIQQWSQNFGGATRWPLRDVAMSDDGMAAVAVGGPIASSRNPGQILLTEDGGENWRHLEIGELSVNLNPMSVATSGDGALVIVVGRSNDSRGAAVLRSTSGGARWASVAAGAPRLQHVALSRDGAIALAVGSLDPKGERGVILRSLDGGANWTPVETELRLPVLTSIFLDHAGEHAVASAEDGRLIVSSDGGATWAETGAYQRVPGVWYYLALLVGAALLFAALRTLKPDDEGQQLADHYTNDTPIDRADADRLQFSPLASGLSHFLRNRNTEPPLTIAITGQWGSGKTSLMRLLQRDLKNHGMSTVWFNAWHHQTEDSLLASLLEAIRQRGIPALWRPEGMIFRVRLLAMRLKRDVRNSFYWFTIVLLCGFAVAIFTGDGSLNTLVMNQLPTSVSGFLKPLESSLPVGPIVTLAALIVGIFWLIARGRILGIDPARLIVRTGQRARIRDLQQQLSVRHRFASEFADVTAALRPMSTLAIVIDDLDRCQSDRVLEILESVNFLISAGRCYVIFGMDLGPVIAAVKSHFRDTAEKMIETDAADTTSAVRDLRTESDSEFARQYLEKLINIEVPVPALQAGAIDRLIAQRSTRAAATSRSELGSWLHRFRLGSMVAGLWIGLLGLVDTARRRSSDWLRYFRVASMVAGLWIGLLGLSAIVGVVTQTQLDRLAAAITEAEESAPPPAEEQEKTTRFNFAVVVSQVDPAQPDKLSATILRAGSVAGTTEETAGARGGSGTVPAAAESAPAPDPATESANEDEAAWAADILQTREQEPEDVPRGINRSSIAAPSLADRIKAHKIWTFLLPTTLAAFAVVALTVVGRWRSSRTEDSPAFTEALVRWAPVSQTLCRTPRAFKRYQNRVRFLAMRQEREHGGSGLIPEAMLVALGAIQTLDPKLTTPKHFFRIFERSGELKSLRDLPQAFSSEAFQKTLEVTLAKQRRKHTEGPSWPPNEKQLQTFNALSSGFFVARKSDATN